MNRHAISLVLAGFLAAVATAQRAPIHGVYNLRATATDAGVLIEWQTEGAANLVAFQVQRASSTNGPWTVLHDGWLTTAPDEPVGYSLKRLDTTTPDKGVVYRLTARDARGFSRDYGPVSVTSGTGKPVDVGQAAFHAERLVVPVRAPMVAVPATKSLPRSATAEPAVSKLKITLRDTGLYFLSTQDIATGMGWTTNEVATLLAQHRLRLSNRGRKTAYLPAPAGSGLYLFNDFRPDVYSEQEVVWLERGRGLVLPDVAGAVPPEYVPDAGTFTETLRAETNVTFSTVAFSDPEKDYWTWLLLAAGPSCSTSLPVRLPSVTSGAGRLAVRLVGATSTGFSGEHHVILSVNGTQVGEAVWEGIVANTWSFTIPDGILSNGTNQVHVQSPLDSGAPYGYVWFDWFEIQYNRVYEADGDQLLCPGAVAGPVTVSGFTDPDILVVDISDRSLPRLVSGAQVQSTNAAYAVSFASAGTNATYFVCTRSSVRAATNLIACAFTGLRSATNQADYLAFSVPVLTNELARLIAYRQAGGWTPQARLTQQAYDEFNYGRLSPHALRRCLAHAQAQWSLPPTHAVLAGEGSLDYHNYKGLGGCMVPTFLVNAPDGMFASDNQIADVVGKDGVPELAIGRLVAATPAALSNLVDRIIAYETASPGAWLSNAVFAADNPDDGGNFTASSETVAALMPAWLALQKAYLETQSVAVVHNAICDGLNAGVIWLNYFGHGGWNGLASENLLSPADFSSLTNRATPAVLTAMTCLINRFELPGADCFSKRLLLEPPGGVAAVWSATGLSYNNAAETLDRAFYTARYQESAVTLGGAARRALEAGQAQGVPRFELDIMTLLCDPALRLR